MLAARRRSLERRYTYAQAGVREYWVADPDSRRVELYVVEGTGWCWWSPATNGAGFTAG